MADINLSLGLELDPAKLADIQKRLDNLKANINVSSSGGSSGNAAKEQIELEKLARERLKTTQAQLEAEQKLAQEQAKTAQAKIATEQKIIQAQEATTQATLKTAKAQEDLATSVSRAQKASISVVSANSAKEMQEFNEKLAEIKTRMRDAETAFRTLAIAEREVTKATQTNSASLEDLAKAQNDTKIAKANAITVIEAEQKALLDLANAGNLSAVALDKISVAQKSAVEAGQRVKVGFVGMATALDDLNTSHKTANNLLLELGRGFSDAGMFAVDFRMGMLAVSNNISQVVDVGGRLVQKANEDAIALTKAGTATTTWKVALDGLKTSLMGVGGFMLAINIALTAIQLWPKATKEAAESNDVFAESLNRLRSEFDKVNKAITDAEVKLGLISGGGIKETEATLKRTNVALLEQQKLLEAVQQKLDAPVKQAEEALRIKREELALAVENNSMSSDAVRIAQYEFQSATKNLELRTKARDEGVYLSKTEKDRIESLKKEQLLRIENVAVIAKSSTELSNQLKDQKRVKEILGDQTSVIDDANKKKEKQVEIVKEVDIYERRAQESEEQRLKRLEEIAKSKAESLELSIKEHQVLLKTQELATKEAQARREMATINLQNKKTDKAFNEASTYGEAKGILDTKFKEEKSTLELTYQLELISHEEFLDKKFDLDEKYENDVSSLKERSFTKAQEIAGKYFSAVNDLSQFAVNKGLLSARKAFNIQKAVSASETSINTIVTVQKILSQGGLYATPLAIGASIAGAARVAAILSTPFGGTGGRDQSSRTMADGGGSLKEGFSTDKVTSFNTRTGTQDANNSSAFKNVAPQQIIINSQLNNEALTYAVYSGEAQIRQNTTVMKSDV